MRPTFFFTANTDRAKFLGEQMRGAGHKVSFEAPNWFEYCTFFCVTHDLTVYAKFEEPRDMSHFICIIAYHYLIDDKDLGILSDYFHALMCGETYVFPRHAGVLRYLVDPDLKI
jgi:hypothetical protein